MRSSTLAICSIFALALFVAGCGDDDSSGVTCGAGTIESGGACIPDPNLQDTFIPPTDTGGGTDTGGPNDTGGGGVDTVDTGCSADEVGRGDVGAACTKDCQCRQDLPGAPLTCYSGPYHEGFSFCTKIADNSLSSNDGYVSLVFPSECDLEPTGQRIYAKTCASLDDCKQLASAYTHCGTGHFGYTSPSARQTECPRIGKDDGSTMALADTCIIATARPYAGAE